MEKETLEKLKYPVGRFHAPDNFTDASRQLAIETLRALPGKLTPIVNALNDDQLQTPYRPDGWTVKQLVHHIADSHMNSYARFKFGVTEEKPTIMPYDQDAWVKTPENELPVSVPLSIIDGIHQKLSALLSSFSEAEFKRTIIHPEMMEEISLDKLAALYSWHSEHHLAHITELIKREGW